MTTKEEFVEFLACLSDKYKGEKRLWLRLLLNDHCSGEVLSREDVPALEWFNELESKGYIQNNPTDVEILLDITKVTEMKEAIDLIKEFKLKHPNNNEEYNFTKGKPITEYRKRLFMALRENTTKVSKMLAHYSLGHHKFNTIWDFVFILERDKLLVDEEKPTERFAKLLDKKASDLFLGRPTEIRKVKRKVSNLARKTTGKVEKTRIMSDGQTDRQTKSRPTTAPVVLNADRKKTVFDRDLECQQRFTNKKKTSGNLQNYGNKMESNNDQHVCKIRSEIPDSYLNDNQAQYHCTECERYRCEQCIQQHMDLSALNCTSDANVDGTSSQKCSVHTDKKLDYYCLTCKLMICEDCKHSHIDRSNHKMIPIEKALNDINQTVNKTIKIAEDIKEKLNERLDVINKERSELESNFELSRISIETHKNEIIRKVNEESKVMIEKLTQTYEKQKDVIDIHIKSIELKLTQVSSLIESINKMMNKPQETETVTSYMTTITDVGKNVLADKSFTKTSFTLKFVPSQRLSELMKHESVGKLMIVTVNKEDWNISVTKGQLFSVRVSSLAESDVGQLTATLTNLSGEKSQSKVTHRKGRCTITGRCDLEGDWHMNITDEAMSHVIGSPVSIKVEPIGLVQTIENISEYKEHNKTAKVTDVVLGTDGCMLVSSYSRELIKVDQSGCFVSRIQIPQNIQVNYMHQIGNGHMVYSDYLEKCVVMCDNQYYEIRTFGKGVLKYPDGVRINQKNRILYVADRKCHCVFKFNIDDGSLLGKIGSEGSKAGQLKKPTDVAVTKEGHAIVADRENSRIQMFDANDKLIKILVAYGKEDGRVWGPCGITIDMGGNIIVSSNHKLQLFDQNGKFIKRIDKKDDGLNMPLGMAVISKRPRRVAVANHLSSNIKIFSY
ncbi:uncharacterized protein [Antedon mediterranea]|uniref:uncharacterized protein n=1 Tax=Antedon mediterranea TaxID=105859 RepID=UPI003AF6391A